MSEINKLWQRAEDNSQLIADAANDMITEGYLPSPDTRWLWLTTQKCGFAVEVLRQQFEKEGIEAEAVVNPTAKGVRFNEHVLLAVNMEGETYYIDPTYLQFFSEFGLDAPLISESWSRQSGNILPDERAIVFTADTVDSLGDWFAGNILYLLRKWQHSEAWQARYRPGMPGHNVVPKYMPEYGELRRFFASVYDPNLFEPHVQAPDKQKMVADYIKDYAPNRLNIDRFLGALASKKTRKRS